MGTAYELQTLEGLSKQCWLLPSEQRRWRGIIFKWKEQNPKANIVQQMLIETLVRIHLFEQRLIDKRTYFNGDPTDYRVVNGRKLSDLSEEDQVRKDKEFEQWMPQVMRWKEAYLKIALASKIEITGAEFDIAHLVKDYQARSNGESNGNNRPDRSAVSRITPQ